MDGLLWEAGVAAVVVVVVVVAGVEDQTPSPTYYLLGEAVGLAGELNTLQQQTLNALPKTQFWS